MLPPAAAAAAANADLDANIITITITKHAFVFCTERKRGMKKPGRNAQLTRLLSD